MAGYYELFHGRSDYRFRLKAGNHEIILQSEGYQGKAGAQNGIASVQKNSASDDRYERKKTASGYSFVLKAANGEPIGRSEVYESAGGRDNGIESVKTNGPTTDVHDLT